jgi:hypothetical protein
MKKIYFYYQPFCPRSYFSLKNFKKEIKTSDFDLKIIKTFAYKANKKLIFPPCIVYKNRILNGFYLSRLKIKNFFSNFYE